jgi:hypothetical protein
MAFFLKAVAAIAVADAIDRHARGRRARYWYPKRPGLPPPGSPIPDVPVGPPIAEPRRGLRAAGWDPEHPERP